MTLKVLLGIDSLTPPRTGIGRYTAALLRQWLKRPETVQVIGIRAGDMVDDRRILQVLAAETAQAHDWRGPWWRRAASHVPGARTAWNLWRNWRSRQALKQLGVGAIYHEPNYVALPLDNPLVVTVHDISHIRFPQFHPKDRVRWLERSLQNTLERAQVIITVSEFSRREIIHCLGIAAERVVTIFPGREERFRPPDHEDEFHRRLCNLGLVAGGYVASVGTLEPRKNLHRVIDAYAALPDKLRQHFPLVLAGPRGWRTETFWPQLERLQRRGEVRWFGFVADADLPALYAGAAAFVYVSLYEGFGLPVLEAMGCGAPVLTSKDSAMASWAAGGVALVDPLDREAICEGIRRLLEDRAGAARLAHRGQIIAQGLSWSRCAAETLQVYRQVSEQHH